MPPLQVQPKSAAADRCAPNPCFVDGDPGRIAYKLRTARFDVQQFARRRRCASCGSVRECVPVELLAYEAPWYCLSECWPYHLGVLHGRRDLARRAHAAIDDLRLEVKKHRN